MDLHLLHPSATAWWTELDCNFTNRNPDWDAVGVVRDDPRLDLDDVDGKGPENINIRETPSGSVYRIVAHYYSDHCFGPSQVYVNIYCYDELRGQFGPVLLHGDDFWKVADVTMGAAACNVLPLRDSNGPIIVDQATSETER